MVVYRVVVFLYNKDDCIVGEQLQYFSASFIIIFYDLIGWDEWPHLRVMMDGGLCQILLVLSQARVQIHVLGFLTSSGVKFF